MQYGFRSSIKVVAVLGVGLVLLSCSRTFEIKPEGNARATVRFAFYRSDEPAELRVVEFVVQREGSDGIWSVIWELQGKANLRGIEYGRAYEGLSIVVPPTPVLPGARYRALASELTWPNPKGHSAVTFSVDEHGDVVVGSR
jgi:hypothetical protein